MMAWLWLACSKTGTVAPPPPAVRAGPRAVLETPAESDDGEGLSIGRNEAVAYVQEVRTVVMPAFRACVDKEGVTAEDPALVEARVDPKGNTKEVLISRSSGDRAVDDCARSAMANIVLPPPPPRQIDDSGTFELPTFAFGTP
ncbi:MAG: TonB family protein [Myxococcota bacterium]